MFQRQLKGGVRGGKADANSGRLGAASTGKWHPRRSTAYLGRGIRHSNFRRGCTPDFPLYNPPEAAPVSTTPSPNQHSGSDHKKRPSSQSPSVISLSAGILSGVGAVCLNITHASLYPYIDKQIKTNMVSIVLAATNTMTIPYLNYFASR